MAAKSNGSKPIYLELTRQEAAAIAALLSKTLVSASACPAAISESYKILMDELGYMSSEENAFDVRLDSALATSGTNQFCMSVQERKNRVRPKSKNSF